MNEVAVIEVDEATAIAAGRMPATLDVVAETLGLPEGSLHPNGLILTNPDTSFEEWEQFAYGIGFLGRWHRFALGDWLLFGEALFGQPSAQATEGTSVDRYDVAQRITGLQPATLQNYASVCGRVPLPRRRTELDFAHHDAVAALDPEDQVYWLEQAVVNGWDRGELRDAIKASKLPPSEDEGDSVIVEPPLSRSERLEQAAIAIFQTWQPTSDGSYLVPAEPAARLREALGEE